MGKKKSNGYGKGTFVDTCIILSPAYLSLGNKGTSPTVSTSSIKILMLLLGKRQFLKIKDRKGIARWGRADDNKFTLTYKELESKGIKQGSATRGFDELLAKGFISIVDPGGAFEKHKAVYALEEKYLLWRQGDPPIDERKKDIYRGYQNPKHRGTPNKKTTRVNGGHPHACQRGTPPKKTRTSTGDTPMSSESNVLPDTELFPDFQNV
jgi:hypothetical protein